MFKGCIGFRDVPKGGEYLPRLQGCKKMGGGYLQIASGEYSNRDVMYVLYVIVFHSFVFTIVMIVLHRKVHFCKPCYSLINL